jgi:hypothetical protein
LGSIEIEGFAVWFPVSSSFDYEHLVAYTFGLECEWAGTDDGTLGSASILRFYHPRGCSGLAIAELTFSLGERGGLHGCEAEQRNSEFELHLS